MSGRGGIYRGPNGDKLHGDGRQVIASPMPDRVIDAPKKPEGCICPWSTKQGIVFEDNPYCTFHHPEKPDAPIPEDLKALYERSQHCGAGTFSGDHIAPLIERIARLGAEKQDVRTEGLQQVAFALCACPNHARGSWSCRSCQVIKGLLDALTVAKSEGNREAGHTAAKLDRAQAALRAIRLRVNRKFAVKTIDEYFALKPVSDRQPCKEGNRDVTP